MNIYDLTDFFKWCAIFGGILYAISAVFVIGAPDLIYKIQGKMFRLTEETIRTVLYAYMAQFKILYILFVLVPYFALLAME